MAATRADGKAAPWNARRVGVSLSAGAAVPRPRRPPRDIGRRPRPRAATGWRPANDEQPRVRAVVVGDGGPLLADVPEPSPAPGEVKVRVRACGLNRADADVAMGEARGRAAGPGTVVGIEFAGEVAEIGADAAAQGCTLRVGDRVMCSGAAGWAEYAVTDWGRAVPLPDGAMGWTRAATLPVALQTMHNALVTAGGLAAGESVLIQGASSGVGLVGMQVAKAMGAGLVIGSSTDPGRRALLAGFGADLAVDSRDGAWVGQVLDATGGRGVDLVVDQVSGYTVNGNLAATRVLGRIVNVGRLGGRTAEIDCDLHALRRIRYTGVTFRTRSVEEVREIVRAMRADLWDAVAAGRFALPVDAEFPLEEAPAAVARMRANRHFGKIVLTLGA